jgi:hypothetical protein
MSSTPGGLAGDNLDEVLQGVDLVAGGAVEVFLEFLDAARFDVKAYVYYASWSQCIRPP